MSEPIKIKLPSLRQYDDARKFAEAWGDPNGDPYAFSHHGVGGWRALELPPPMDIWVWVSRVVKRKDAVPFLFWLARYSIYSQLTLSEALTFSRELRELMPDYAENTDMVEEWATFGIHAVNASEARSRADKPASIGDDGKAVEEIGKIISWKNGVMLDIAERGIQELRNRAEMSETRRRARAGQEGESRG